MTTQKVLVEAQPANTKHIQERRKEKEKEGGLKTFTFYLLFLIFLFFIC